MVSFEVFFFKFIYYLLFNRFEEKIHVLVSVLEFIWFFVGFFMNRKKRLFIWISRQINPRQSGIVFKIGFLKNVVFLLMPRNVRRNKSPKLNRQCKTGGQTNVQTDGHAIPNEMKNIVQLVWNLFLFYFFVIFLFSFHLSTTQIFLDAFTAIEKI